MLLGPIIGVESDTLYTMCIVAADNHDDEWHWDLLDKRIKFVRLDGWDGASIYRAELEIPAPDQGRFIDYHIRLNGEVAQDVHYIHEWRFYQPAKDESPRISYASCNDFHYAKERSLYHTRMWKHLEQEHQQAPISILLLGGDQIYADPLFHSPLAQPVSAWPLLTNIEKASFVISDDTREALEHFYLNQYIETWSQRHIAEVLATIPSVMMWDDHDIIDGYGSYPPKVQKSPFMQQLFGIAKRCFQSMQLRGLQNRTLINKEQHFSCGLEFRGQIILAMDNRSERDLKRIMKKSHHKDLKEWLEPKLDGKKPVWLLSAVPVLYMGFADVERRIGHVPYFKQWQDDMFDHWRAHWHLKERKQLLTWLSEDVRTQSPMVTILSGDVHVGAQAELLGPSGMINQLTSSGIVNDSPSWFAWLLISLFADLKDEQITQKLQARNLRPFAGKVILREQNYLVMDQFDERWQAKWHTVKREYRTVLCSDGFICE